jgi:methylthioribose-1-phosphate isomerase
MSWERNFESIKKDTNFFAELNNEIVNLNEIISIFEAETDGGKKHTWFRLFDDHIEFLDQRFLPAKEDWIKCKDEKEVAYAIREMVVRGAPAIGISAAFGVVYGVKKRLKNKVKITPDIFSDITTELERTRPTAFNLKNALLDMEQEYQNFILNSSLDNQDELLQRITNRAIKIWFHDFAYCYLIGKFGAELIKDGSVVFTICNTGSLATGGWGTAFSAIRFASKIGKKIEVIALETRPFLQGSRLTAWELMQNKIPFHIIVDSSSAFSISQMKAKGKDICCVAGADRILRDGTTANKIGTFTLAISSKYFDVPFYVLAPSTTIDNVSEKIPIEERNPREVREFFGVRVLPDDVPVFNFAFDITPPNLISAIVTEKGIFRYPYDFSHI